MAEATRSPQPEPALPHSRRDWAATLHRIQNSPIRLDLATGALVELVSEDSGVAVVHPLFQPAGPRRTVPSDRLVRRLSDGIVRG